MKAPATYRYGFCWRLFSLVYNLRIHLRMFTDERLFICSFCGEIFARQYQLERHEGFHFRPEAVCRGSLENGQPQGCRRRFVRLDALDYHFRSEDGRVCIRPLLEAAKRMSDMASRMFAEPFMRQPQPGFQTSRTSTQAPYRQTNEIPLHIMSNQCRIEEVVPMVARSHQHRDLSRWSQR